MVGLSIRTKVGNSIQSSDLVDWFLNQYIHGVRWFLCYHFHNDITLEMFHVFYAGLPVYGSWQTTLIPLTNRWAV